MDTLEPLCRSGRKISVNDHDHSRKITPPASGFWRSRPGIALIVFLVAAGLLLGYEHRVHLFTGTGVLIALLALCVGMHFFMHGGHGGHGGGSGDDDGRDRP